MNLLDLMFAMFLTAAPCQARPISESAEYRISHVDCGEQHWDLWQHICVAPRNEDNWFGPVYYMVEERSQTAFYVNRFAEIQGGKGAQITEAYVPRCG
jgi:hypothetical protein